MKTSTFAFCLFSVLLMTGPLSAQTIGPRTADDLVTLTGGFYGRPPGCGPWRNAFPVNNRAKSDGRHEVPWAVPAGHKLIITGIDWVVESTGALDGGSDTMFVSSLSSTGGAGTDIFYEIVAPGRAAHVFPLSGVAVDSGFTFCVGKSGPWNFSKLSIRGYLVENRGGRP